MGRRSSFIRRIDSPTPLQGQQIFKRFFGFLVRHWPVTEKTKSPKTLIKMSSKLKWTAPRCATYVQIRWVNGKRWINMKRVSIEGKRGVRKKIIGVGRRWGSAWPLGVQLRRAGRRFRSHNKRLSMSMTWAAQLRRCFKSHRGLGYTWYIPLLLHAPAPAPCLYMDKYF